MRFDPDKAAERATRAIVQRVLVEKIARSVRRDVVLQGAGIEFLVACRDGNGQQIAAPAFPNQPAQAFEPRIFAAKVKIQTHGRRIVIDRCRIHLQRADVFAPGLGADVGDFCAGPGDQVVDSTGKTGEPFDRTSGNARPPSPSQAHQRPGAGAETPRHFRRVTSERSRSANRFQHRVAQTEMFLKKPGPCAARRIWPSRALPVAT